LSKSTGNRDTKYKQLVSFFNITTFQHTLITISDRCSARMGTWPKLTRITDDRINTRHTISRSDEGTALHPLLQMPSSAVVKKPKSAAKKEKKEKKEKKAKSSKRESSSSSKKVSSSKKRKRDEVEDSASDAGSDASAPAPSSSAAKSEAKLTFG